MWTAICRRDLFPCQLAGTTPNRLTEAHFVRHRRAPLHVRSHRLYLACGLQESSSMLRVLEEQLSAAAAQTEVWLGSSACMRPPTRPPARPPAHTHARTPAPTRARSVSLVRTPTRPAQAQQSLTTQRRDLSYRGQRTDLLVRLEAKARHIVKVLQRLAKQNSAALEVQRGRHQRRFARLLVRHASRLVPPHPVL